MHEKFLTEIDKLLIKGSDYQLSEPPELGRGFVFCPELTSADPIIEPTTDGTETPVYLFGPSTLPDLAAVPSQPPPTIPKPANDSHSSPEKGDCSRLSAHVHLTRGANAV